ncbi:MAG: NAD(P)-dependent oxidoreductase [Gammaproteobacteria bacterium]
MRREKGLRIAVIGAAGNVGRRIVAEAVTRGHRVTAVVRDSVQRARLPASVAFRTGDASRSKDVEQWCRGQDLLISAVRPPPGKEDLLVTMTRSILLGARRAGVRVLLVGGAASLKLPGKGSHTVLTAPGYLPASVVPIARACNAQYEACLADTKTDWTYLSPPSTLEPGVRTGKFRLGTDELLVDDRGDSAISMEDFAVALLDEVENPQHRRTRFTVAY